MRRTIDSGYPASLRVTNIASLTELHTLPRQITNHKPRSQMHQLPIQRTKKDGEMEDFITTITTHGVENESAVCTMVEFNSTVVHRVIGSTLAAESAALATARGRQFFLRLT